MTPGGTGYRPIEAHGICRTCGWLCERRQGQVHFCRADNGELCTNDELHQVRVTDECLKPVGYSRCGLLLGHPGECGVGAC